MSCNSPAQRNPTIVGDYYRGEECLYQVTALDRDRGERPYYVTVSAGSTTDTPGWKSPLFVQSLGKRVPKESLNSISVSDGDKLIWKNGHTDGTSAVATITIATDGHITLDSDGLFVPSSYSTVIELKADIVLLDVDFISN